jgi:hypothetical protein
MHVVLQLAPAIFPYRYLLQIYLLAQIGLYADLPGRRQALPPRKEAGFPGLDGERRYLHHSTILRDVDVVVAGDPRLVDALRRLLQELIELHASVRVVVPLRLQPRPQNLLRLPFVRVVGTNSRLEH